MKVVERFEVIMDNVLETMDGVIRISSVTIYFTDTTYKNHPELVDNEEFDSEEALEKRVSERHNISKDYIEIY